MFGIVAVTNAMLPLLRRSPAPRIVNVSSEVGSISSMTDPDSPLWPMASVPYPASKAAVNMITVKLARALPRYRINAVCPGYTATDLNDFAGVRTVEQGDTAIVRAATLGADGPTATFFDEDGPIAW